MPQRKQLTWAELRVGLFVLVGLAVLAAGIFYVTGAGILGPKYRLKTFLPEVSGLSKGASVKLDGVEIGNVEAIQLVPRTPGSLKDKNRNVEVDMRIDRRYEKDILTDSVATLVTEGLLGNRYVDIRRGFTGVPIKENQEIPGAEEKAIKEVVERSAELLGNLTALLATHRLQDGFALANFHFEKSSNRVVPNLKNRTTNLAATRFLVLRDGKIYFEGAPEQFAASTDPYLKRFLV